MIDPSFLSLLRCPLDRQRETPLILEDTKLLCSRCRLQFRTRDGFASFLIDEATLPEGCGKVAELPCQRNPEHRSDQQV